MLRAALLPQTANAIETVVRVRFLKYIRFEPDPGLLKFVESIHKSQCSVILIEKRDEPKCSVPLVTSVSHITVLTSVVVDYAFLMLLTV